MIKDDKLPTTEPAQIEITAEESQPVNVTVGEGWVIATDAATVEKLRLEPAPIAISKELRAELDDLASGGGGWRTWIRQLLQREGK